MKTPYVLGGFAVLSASVLFIVYSGGQGNTSADARASAWKQAGYIKASTPGDGDQFGYAVALSDDGSTLVVGAQMESSAATGVNGNQDDDTAFNAGAVYVFTRSGGGWAQQAYLKASNTDASDQFGASIAVSGDGNTVAVAAPMEDSGSTGVNGNGADNSVPEAGAVYVFTRSAGAWTQQAYIKASNTGGPEDGDGFAYAIALSDDGNTLAVGANSEDSAATGINGNQADDSTPNAGAVYVFSRTDNAWSQQAYLKTSSGPEATGNDMFGYSVALSADGNTLGVGVYDESGSSNVINGPIDGRTPGTGAVYVFTRNGTTWAREAYLKASTQDRNDSMGAWIAISDDGNTLAAGALDEDSMTTGVNAVKSGDSGITDSADDNSSGAAYVFTRSGTTWSQQASFKASNTGKNDWFGIRLALSGDGNTLAVGAPNEDSAAQGIDGKQDDDSATEAGAVYVFARDGNSWSQHAYVKGSNTQEFDELGGAIALSKDGRLMAVGAKYEDGGTKGSGDNEGGEAISDSGAVYIYAR